MPTRENSTRYQLRLNTVKDADIIAHLNSQDNMTDYLRRLVRSDLIIQQLLHVESEGSGQDA